jgi:hypothetical protein
MMDTKFKFRDSVKIKENSFYDGARGVVVGYDEHYYAYLVDLGEGVLRNFTEYNLEKADRPKRKVVRR